MWGGCGRGGCRVDVGRMWGGCRVDLRLLWEVPSRFVHK